MRFKIALCGLMASSLAISGPATAEVLAQCGASVGHAYFAIDNAWTPDQISKGSLIFLADDKGNPNVHFKDASGGTIDAAADGGKLTFSFIHPAQGEFGIVVVYEQTGVFETYHILTLSDGKKRVYWTTNKSNAAPLAKVGAYIADCR